MAIIKTDKTIAELRKACKTCIFYERDGNIIIRSRPDYSSGKVKRCITQNTTQFTEAHKIAKIIMAEPGKKAEYEAKRSGSYKSAYKVLWAEIFKNLKTMSYGHNNK
jgi:hypothetical protein